MFILFWKQNKFASFVQYWSQRMIKLTQKLAKSVPRCCHMTWTSGSSLRTQMIYSYFPCFPSRYCCVYLLWRGYCCFKVLIAQVRLKWNEETLLKLDTRRWIPQLKPRTDVFVYLLASIFSRYWPLDHTYLLKRIAKIASLHKRSPE